MRAFIDTEFMEFDGRVELLSIGIVKETYSRVVSFYGVNATADTTRANEFVVEHVLPRLHTCPLPIPIVHEPVHQLGRYVETFLHPHAEKWEIWAYYADYDWVAFCSMWRRMVALPEQMPRYCLDLKQELWARRLTREALPPDDADEHHALADAHWTRRAYHTLMAYPPARSPARLIPTSGRTAAQLGDTMTDQPDTPKRTIEGAAAPAASDAQAGNKPEAASAPTFAPFTVREDIHHRILPEGRQTIVEYVRTGGEIPADYPRFQGVGVLTYTFGQDPRPHREDFRFAIPAHSIEEAWQVYDDYAGRGKAQAELNLRERIEAAQRQAQQPGIVRATERDLHGLQRPSGGFRGGS